MKAAVVQHCCCRLSKGGDGRRIENVIQNRIALAPQRLDVRVAQDGELAGRPTMEQPAACYQWRLLHIIAVDGNIFGFFCLWRVAEYRLYTYIICVIHSMYVQVKKSV